jgi:transcriptional regulator with XRE-family HTH domain
MRSESKISGTKLHDLRAKRLQTTADISTKSGVHSATILKIEKNPESNVRFGTLRKLATAFEMTPEEFLAAVSPKM